MRRWLAIAWLSGTSWAQAPKPAPQTLFAEASQALQSGELANAERLFCQFLALEPRNVGGLGNLGVVYSRQGLPSQAAEVWERALRLAPNDAGLRTNLGLAYLRLEEYAKARSVLEPVRTVQGRELHASAQLFGGDPAAALLQLQSLHPTPGVLYLTAVAQLKLKRKNEAAATFSRLTESVLDPDQVAFLRGKAEYEAGSFEPALESFLSIKSPQPGLALELGKVYVSLRDAANAEAKLREAIRERPLDAEANYFLGALLVQQDMATSGLPFLENAIRARPSFWGAQFYLGRGLLATGRAAAAVHAMERARTLHPKEPQIDFHLSKAYAATGNSLQSAAALTRFRNARQAQRDAEREALVLR